MKVEVYSDIEVKQLPSKEKRYKVYFNRSFYVEVLPSGKKSYRVRHEEQIKTLGTTDEFTFEEATELAHTALAEFKDPTLIKKTFSEVFQIWTMQKTWAESTRAKRESIINNYLQIFKKTPIQDIKRLQILEELRKIEKQGKYETTYKALCIIRQVFEYAVICGYIENNPAIGLQGAIKKQVNEPRAALVDEVGAQRLVNAIYRHEKDVIRGLFKFTMFTLCRPGESRKAKWGEIEGEVWKIPKERMKLRKGHIVPLPTQCLEILEQMKTKIKTDDPEIIKDRYIFPSHIPGRALSENTLIINLRKMGFSRDEMSIHGFRSMGSTILNEQGYRHDVIEKALAHAGEDKIRAIYNRAEYFNERRQMLQDYADYLDRLLITKEEK